MTQITIEWSHDRNGSICYSVNGLGVGHDSKGFEAVLQRIRENPEARVILKNKDRALGGEDLSDTTPFADRFPELVRALGGRSLTWDLM